MKPKVPAKGCNRRRRKSPSVTSSGEGPDGGSQAGLKESSGRREFQERSGPKFLDLKSQVRMWATEPKAAERLPKARSGKMLLALAVTRLLVTLRAISVWQ